MHVYINGQESTLYNQVDSYSSFNTNSYELWIGAGAESLYQHRSYKGALDDIRLYRRAIPLRLIQALAAANDDQDGDGLPDAWETLHFGNLTTANATTDSDGDHIADWMEYLAGTDPNSAASYFHITAITPQGNDIVLTWRAGAGHTNVVQAAPNLKL